MALGQSVKAPNALNVNADGAGVAARVRGRRGLRRHGSRHQEEGPAAPAAEQQPISSLRTAIKAEAEVSSPAANIWIHTKRRARVRERERERERERDRAGIQNERTQKCFA